MKKLFLILIGVFFLSFVSAVSVYDNFNDNALDNSIWTNATQISSGGTASINETNGNLSMGVDLSSASDTARVNLTTTRDFISPINWSVTDMDITPFGGADKWTFCGVRIGEIDVVVSNKTMSTFGNYSNGAWGIYTSGGNTFVTNNTATLRTIPSVLTGKVTFTCLAESGAGGGVASMNQTIDNFLMNPESVTLISPSNDTSILNRTTYFIANHSSEAALVNTTFNLWWNNGSYYNTTFFSIIGSTNTTNLSIGLGIGNYLWGHRTCDSSVTCTTTSNFSLNESAYINEINTFNSSTYETGVESFILNITTNSGTSTAVLVYNGTSYSVSNSGTSTNPYFLKTLDIATVSNSTNKTFYWNVTTDATTTRTSTQTQQIDSIDFALCNSSVTAKYINFTFKDESNLAFINATIPTSTFSYWLGTGTINKTLTFSNTTANLNYTFCFTPAAKSVNVDSRIQYASSGYPQRTYDPSVVLLSNTTTSTTLYLLATADGLYVTFQVINQAEQALSDVEVTATRVVDSVQVGNGLTDAAGTITFWLNPDFSHTLVFEKDGYDTFTTVITPTQSSYTITLGGATTSTQDYNKGVSYFLNPATDFLDNYSLYSFNLTLNSEFWDLQKFGFDLFYGNDTLIGSNSSTATRGGVVSLFGLNSSSDQTTIYMNYYYLINGNYTNLTRVWIIQPTYGRTFSIWNFFQDLGTYIDAGFFGFDNFGKLLLSFVVIVLVAGGLSYNYGLRSEAAVMGIVFGMVFLLDVGLGFIPRIEVAGIRAVPNFLTIVTFIILMAFIIKEERT